MWSFQRLSHACLSTCVFNTKPRMAHYNSYNLLDFDINPTWITVVILELIHAQKLNLMGSMRILVENQASSDVLC